MVALFDDFYRGLEAYYADSFPKRCASCGHVFETAASFIAETEAVRGNSGLRQGLDELGQVVELFRNCACGSTLMDVFADRRAPTDASRARRRHFEELQVLLENSGLSTAEARLELRRFFGGQESRIQALLGGLGPKV